jgi:glycerol-3-phosphate acyltransferase PlsX
MGSDTHPEPEIGAAIEASRTWGDTILLTGPQELLQSKLDAQSIPRSMVEVIHAPEVLEMTDKPAETARGKSMNSMAVGMDLVKTKEADVFVTAGNTGGAMANALFRLGRIRGVKRPGLSVIIPVYGGQTTVVDIGANVDCKPSFLVQFAIMGSIYVEKMLALRSPRVGLLSNGEEAGKGNALVKDTYPLLESAGVNFIGNVEPKEIFAGEVDVVVTDGFSGNVLVKTAESVAALLTDIIRDEIMASPISSIGGLLSKPAFRRVGRILDPSEHGAAPFLGIDGLVFVGHGRYKVKGLVSSIRVARQAVENDLLGAMREAIQTRLESINPKESS